VQVNDVLQDLGDIIHDADMSSNRDVAMLRRRRRQLARKIAGHWVFVLAEVRIERSAGLETRFLVRREPILRSAAGGFFWCWLYQSRVV